MGKLQGGLQVIGVSHCITPHPSQTTRNTSHGPFPIGQQLLTCLPPWDLHFPFCCEKLPGSYLSNNCGIHLITTRTSGIACAKQCSCALQPHCLAMEIPAPIIVINRTSCKSVNL
uniref:Uncharacterized protein n=1 Tax=Micrurus spixii TaxID=129469 RepID=A0A2D4LIF0_9SAUR